MYDNEDMELKAGEAAGTAADNASELQGVESVSPAEMIQPAESAPEEQAAETYETGAVTDPQAVENYEAEAYTEVAAEVAEAEAYTEAAAEATEAEMPADMAQETDHAAEAAAAAAGADAMYPHESGAEAETAEFHGLKHSFGEAAGKFAAAAQNDNIKNAKNKLVSTFQLAIVAVRKPIEAVNNVLFRGKETEGLILGAMNLFILFLTNTIHLSFSDISAFYSVGGRAKLALFMALIAALWIVLLAAGGYSFRRKDVHKLNYRKVLGAFCCITVPATLATVAVFLLGFVSGTLAMFLNMLACVVTFCFAMILMYLIVDGTPDVKTWKTAGIFLVVSLIISICAVLMLTSMITTLATTMMGNPYSLNYYG